LNRIAVYGRGGNHDSRAALDGRDQLPLRGEVHQRVGRELLCGCVVRFLLRALDDAVPKIDRLLAART
jgi:hypothetical protein